MSDRGMDHKLDTALAKLVPLIRERYGSLLRLPDDFDQLPPRTQMRHLCEEVELIARSVQTIQD